MSNLENPFLKFLQWMHRMFRRIMPGNPDNVTSLKLEAKSEVPEPDPERPQSFSAAEHRRVDVCDWCSSDLLPSPAITIQEDKQDDKGLEQTKPNPFFTTFMSRSTPAQLHFPMEDTLPSTAMLHETKRTQLKRGSEGSQEIVGGLLSTSLSQHVPLGFISTDVDSHDNNKLKVTEDQRYPENANSVRFSTNPSKSVHSSNIQGSQTSNVPVQVTAVPQTANPSTESTEASGGSSPREGYRQDTETFPSKDASINTLYEFSPKDVEVDQSETFGFSSDKALQFTGEQYAVHLPIYDSSDTDVEQDETSSRGSSSVWINRNKSSFSIKTYESSEGSPESSPDQAEDIPYSAASPNDQEKADPELDIPKEELQAGQVKASFSTTGKDTTISTVFMNQILLGDDTKVKPKPPEVGHQDSYQRAEASSSRDFETEEQQKSPFTSSGKEARVDGTAPTPYVADEFPFDIPRIETIPDETDDKSDLQGEEQPARHRSIDLIRISPSSSSFMNRQIYSEPAISKLASDDEEIRKPSKNKTRPDEDQDQENYNQKGGITLKDSKLMQIEPAGRHTVNLTEHRPSLLSLSDQDTSAAQGETTRNSTSVSDEETTGLPKTGATSEEVIGEASSQQEEDTALNIEESGQEYTRGKMSLSLPRLHYSVEANDTTSRYHSLVEISKSVSSSQAQSSKHDQKIKDAALLKVPTKVIKQHNSERGSNLNQPSKSQKKHQSKYQSLTPALKVHSLSIIQRSESESEKKTKLKTTVSDKGVLARAHSRQDAEGENHLGNQLLSDVQLNIATETFMPSVSAQTQTEVTQTTPDEVNLGDNLQQETRLPAETGSSQDVEGENHPGGQPSRSRSEEVPTGAESRQDVEGEHYPGDSTLSDVQLDVDPGTSVSSLADQEVLTENYSSLEVGEDKPSSELSSSSTAELGKEASHTHVRTSEAQASRKPPQPSSNQTETSDLAHQKEDFFANMIASAMKEVEMEQRSAEVQKHHPKPTERCKKAILFPEVVVADQEKGILSFKMHKYVLEQDRTVAAKQHKSKSGSAKSHSTCKYVRKNEDSRKRQESRETSLTTQNADPQLMTSTVPNNENVQQSDEVEVVLPKEGPHRQARAS
ncbi:uncharacterized protein LOC134348380 isoform X2 [Mobula hypostoma]|uniref:uncharacterized protein LOC134348380 isoform X2 n=1 Tax=Mobula hypostoma TaxID=723540 RepID=UPI002FC2F4C0